MPVIFQETHLNNHGHEKNSNNIYTPFTRIFIMRERES